MEYSVLARKSSISDIVKQYGSKLKGYIRHRVNSAEDAEDVFQDVLYQLARTDTLLNPVEQVSSWLFTVARNRIIDLYRKKKDEPASDYVTDDDDEDEFYDIAEILSSSDDSPDTEYLRSLVWTELEKALSELPEEQRKAFEMNELQDISFREMSKMTGEPENTLISRKRYAVLFLRERLKDLYEDLLNF